jgi:hypothetical protein
MKRIELVLMVFLSLCMAGRSYSQVTSVPEEAKENFARQYPDATNVSWSNNVINAGVTFELKGEKMYAEYSNKGIWKETYRDWEFIKLPDAVKDGFEKSKYAEWKVKSVKLVSYPGNIERYRIEVERNELQKKYLYFNTKGRLVRSSISI